MLIVFFDIKSIMNSFLMIKLWTPHSMGTLIGYTYESGVFGLSYKGLDNEKCCTTCLCTETRIHKFFIQCSITVLDHLLTPLIWSLWIFFYFHLKAIMKAAHSADMQKCVTEVLWWIPKDEFVASFQKLYDFVKSVLYWKEII